MQFLAYFILFLAYMSVAVYGNDPDWTTSELIAYPQGRAALALECILMIMMFGQVRTIATSRPHASLLLLQLSGQANDAAATECCLLEVAVPESKQMRLQKLLVA